MDINTNTTSSSEDKPNKRALVLGGGGSIGNAWLIGMIAGLYDAGLDVTQADMIIGTSAGSTAAVQISGGTKPPQLLANILAETAQRPATTAAPGPVANRPVVNPLETTNRIIEAAEDVMDMRRKIGAWALDNTAISSTQWRAIVAARIPNAVWPQKRLLITAVNAHTGEPIVFDQHSGTELIDAVAASCAGGFAYSIGDKKYIDGGYRTNADNADLAMECDRVLVLSPFGGKSRLPASWGLHLETQVAELRAGGSKVETIFPDSIALEAFGNNMMDVSRRAPSAQAGYEHGKAFAVQLNVFWQ